MKLNCNFNNYYVTKLLQGRRHSTHVYSPQTGSPQHSEVHIPPHSNLVNHWVLLGVTYNNIGEGLFTGVEIIQRQLHHQSPFQHGWELNVFQAAKLTSAFSRQLIWSQGFLCSLSCMRVTLKSPVYSWRRGLVNLVSFGDFLKLVWVV